MPAVCACCLEDADVPMEIKGQHVKHVFGGQEITTFTFPFPYCRACKAHVRRNEVTWGVVIGAGIVGAFGAMGIIGFSDVGGGGVLLSIAGGAAASAIAWFAA